MKHIMLGGTRSGKATFRKAFAEMVIADMMERTSHVNSVYETLFPQAPEGCIDAESHDVPQPRLAIGPAQ